ncbi:helix-turn-helix transcriptional regulator [Anaerolineales bacterium HSG6]|nr:helix-turn-helix transcriptional regulator [Anaerolineales bacterium HSG6]
MSRFGEKLRTLRTQQGLTLQQVADAVGATNSYISKMERGQSLPTIDLALKIARFFEVTVDDLADDSVEIGT